MSFLTVFCILVLFEVYVVSGETQCSDCILLRDCQGAIDYIDKGNQYERAEGKQKLRDAFCGRQSINGSELPMVCCSQFTNEKTIIVRYDVNKDDIEYHPNLSLLPEPCGNLDGMRIYGGTTAGIYEFPWMALISRSVNDIYTGEIKKFICAGSIINSRYVLTAAHCVTNLSQGKIAGVRIGDYDIKNRLDCQANVCESYFKDFAIEEIIPHKDYKNYYFIHDIALLRLKRSIDFDHKNVKPVCLPVAKELRERQITSGNETATVAGWGLTENGSESSVLKKVSIPISSDATCRNYFDKEKKIICAGKPGKDSCNGDSGGPLMLEGVVNGKYRPVLYGIVSSGSRSCGKSQLAAYTDVTKYIKWILDTIKV